MRGGGWVSGTEKNSELSLGRSARTGGKNRLSHREHLAFSFHDWGLGMGGNEAQEELGEGKPWSRLVE